MNKFSNTKMFLPVLLLILVSGNAFSQTNEECMMCHFDEDLQSVTSLGETHSAFVDTLVYNQSVHNQIGLECVSCHQDIAEIPHEDDLEPADCAMCHDEIDAEYRESLHGYALSRNNQKAPVCQSCHGKHDIFPVEDERSHANRRNLPQTCGSCHNDHSLKIDPEIRIAGTVELYLGSIHGKNISEGIADAATCSDCHGTHSLKGAADFNSTVNRRNIPNTCSKCHGDIFDEYQKSIHGRALNAGITDAPVCTDCHGEHSIVSTLDPEISMFKMALSENICADCHENPRLIEKYGLLAGTLKTYQDSYHGMANATGTDDAATCVSCHGSHLILPASNENSTIHVNNVAETCGKCHENSSVRFAESYSHAILKEENNTIDSFVRVFYISLIVLVIGGMLIHNAIILSKYIREKYLTEKKNSPLKRFDKSALFQHIILTVSFVILAITGFALRFPDAFWVKPLLYIGFTETLRGFLHHFSAVILIGMSVYHLYYIAFTRSGRSELNAIWLRFQDIKDIKTNLMYHLGKSGNKPQFDKFDYSEKLEYWALIWGTAIMIFTGFVLWFPTIFVQYLPIWAIKVSETVHYYEAWLATLAIVVWHFFFVILHPDEYPMSMTWLTGKMSKKEAQTRHPKWYERTQHQNEELSKRRSNSNKTKIHLHE